MYVDSKQKILNIGQILGLWLKNNPNQPYPPKVMLPAILTELSHEGVETKQIGNTLFEIIDGKEGEAFFKAFNADTGKNFVENSKLFTVYAKTVLKIRKLVTEFTDPTISQLFKIIAMNPPMPNMNYQERKTPSGSTVIHLNLGA
jgi:hypothetical protein